MATVKLLANENAAESRNSFDWLSEFCKEVSVIIIDKMTATDSAILVSVRPWIIKKDNNVL